MRSTPGFPPSVILEGPVFSDELSVPPQQFRQTHEIESLRLVPAKSASSGVHTVYFRPDHRNWALVRLAKRYRWVLEIQLNRGLSGEQQLLNQQFTEADIEFLFDIFPRPPHQYNPIVYDMLWLVATYDEYLRLTRALTAVESFTPRELIDRSPEIEDGDASFLTRFLRHHLISAAESNQHRNAPRSRTAKATSHLDLDTTYVITKEGATALDGIVNEYDRIFVRGEFEPLLINPDLDPVEHLREFEAENEVGEESISLEDVQDNDDILGEIAESFSSLEIEESQPEERSQPAPKTKSSIRAEPHRPTGHSTTSEDLSVDPDANTPQTPRSGTDDEVRKYHDESGVFGVFTREEILEATVVAARLIQSDSVVRTNAVKETVAQSISVGDRSPGQLWDLVSQTLRSMDCIVGRPGGRIWLYVPPTEHHGQ